MTTNVPLDAKLTKAHQLKVFFITATLYSFLHAARTAWAYTKPTLSREFHYSGRLLGWFDFSFLAAYGVGLFLNGFLGDRLKIKSLLTQGMLMTCFALMAFSFEAGFLQISTVVFGIMLFLLNGLGQSTAYPNMINILSNWFPPSQRGLVFGAWCTNGSIGNIVGQQIAKLTIDVMQIHWPYAILSIAFAILILTGVMYKFTYVSPAECYEATYQPENNPAGSAGLRVNPESLNDLDQNVSQRPTAPSLESTDARSIGFWEAWKIPGVIPYAIAFMSIKATVSGITFWLPSYLKLDVGFQKETAEILAFFEIGHLLGALGLGYLADKKKKYRSYMMAGSLIVAMLSFLTLSFVKSPHNFFIYSLLLFIGGFSIGGPSSFIGGAVSSDLGEQDDHNSENKTKVKATSTIIGIIDGSGTVAAAGIQPLIPLFRTHSFLVYSALLFCSAAIIPFAHKKAGDSKRHNDVTYHQEDLDYYPEELGI